MTLRIVTGGLQTTVQDLGRVGFQRKGVPVGGAMDRVALRLANILVGNDDNAACLEAALIGPSLRIERDSVIALTGGDLEATLDGDAVPLWRPLWVRAGGTLRFGQPRVGCRAYLAIAGGIDVPTVFGSRSTYLRASFGGCDGRALKAGDLLFARGLTPLAQRITNSLRAPDRRVSPARWSVSVGVRPSYADDAVVRVVEGAHTRAMTDAAYQALTTATFRVSSTSDRMGYRLEGQELTLREPLELLSEGTTFGTVQLPPGGAPIVLMADAQTTGGYPRIGEVSSVDLPLIAQLKPGDRLRFQLVSIDEAQSLYLAHEHDITQARLGIALGLPRGSA
ncbi:MAG TPA: biotin-dependent carboxyltransferase family protein [Gemmatimonadaceae bacterium]